MVVNKKKLNVIRPTLRHKKRYVHFSFSKEILSDPYNLFTILNNNFQKVFGVFLTAKANITVIDLDLEKREVIVRVNKFYLNQFLGSLFFLK
ncbi:MAG: Rpp14/Pop5 family protein, partial [archaeon]